MVALPFSLYVSVAGCSAPVGPESDAAPEAPDADAAPVTTDADAAPVTSDADAAPAKPDADAGPPTDADAGPAIVCPAGKHPGYKTAGCGQAAQPTCLWDIWDACARTFCACDGKTMLIGCEGAPAPYASEGVCPPSP